MAYRQTIGEAFSKPYEQVTRAGGNLSRSRMNNTRTEQMPEQLDLRRQAIQSRIQLIQHQMQMAQERMNLMGQGQNERAREFDILQNYRDRALEQQKGLGGLDKRAPAYLKALADAHQAAIDAGAIKQDGTIDLERLKQNPEAFARYKYGMQYAGKNSTTAQGYNRAMYSKVLDQTMSLLDVNKLKPAIMAYSGISGKSTYLNDLVKSKRGKQVPDYFYDYQAFENLLPALTKQTSQFWGTSITPEAQAQIAKLLNQDSWTLSGNQRLKNLENVQNLLKAEGSTYQDLITDPQNMQAYQENQENINSLPSSTLGAGPGNAFMGSSGKIYSEDVIKQLMDEYGATRDEVLDILRRGG